MQLGELRHSGKTPVFAEGAVHPQLQTGSPAHVCVNFLLQDELFAPLQCQPDFPASRKEVAMDLKTLLQ